MQFWISHGTADEVSWISCIMAKERACCVEGLGLRRMASLSEEWMTGEEV